jgi:cation diffusion facilitator CzcD-associated flavoprotein CzcO
MMNGHANGGHEHLDVAIIGAGISGINVAYRVQTKLPTYTFQIFEARDSIGGTWDLFRYPGIRSDSDFYTFGFEWNPWSEDQPIVPGEKIKTYLHRSVKQFGIDRHIRFRQRVVAADWSSDALRWTLTIDVGDEGQRRHVTARFLVLGTGYYDYKEPLKTVIPGMENFKGPTIHPQFWPQDLDYTNKKVVIIGSGATAVTLVPSLAEKAAHVTMVQRSPTYIFALPNRTRRWFSWLLPAIIQHKLIRIGWILLQRISFLLCQAFPSQAKRLLRRTTIQKLGGALPHDPHFSPRYNPWDQRLCIAPDGDFYAAIRSGRADVKTATIRTVTDKGVQLDTGEFIEADIIVTATGLKILFAGGAQVVVDGEKVDVSDKYMWNGMMLQDVPNTAAIIGYTNASWTLGADASALLICRLLQYMDRRGATAAIPRVPATADLKPRKLMNLNSTYLEVAAKYLPKAADQWPWQPRSNYLSDLWQGMFGRIDTGLEFVAASRRQANGKA